MGFFDFLKPKKQGAPNAFAQMHNQFLAMCEGGCETDEIPGGSGEFGHEITNPIPTATPFGSDNYLSRLRSVADAKIVFERQGSFTCVVSPHPIDGYTISLPDGKKLAFLYLSPYQKKNSNKAPKGFTLVANKGR